MTLRIEIVSDVICPWCFVAKRRLVKALQLLGTQFEDQVIWLPFQLNPDMPKRGMDRKVYRSAKFGSWEKSQALDAHVAAVGATEGIDFAFDRINSTPNTFDAHRLIWFAQQEGGQDALVEALFHGYFIEGRDIGEHQVLAEIAGALGMDAQKALRFLNSGEGAVEVRAEEERTRHMGISSVPSFLVNCHLATSGALLPQHLAAALHAVLQSPQDQCSLSDRAC